MKKHIQEDDIAKSKGLDKREYVKQIEEVTVRAAG